MYYLYPDPFIANIICMFDAFTHLCTYFVLFQDPLALHNCNNHLFYNYFVFVIADC